ncbi:MAG TPA: aminopeptidase P family protein [Dongiaceae bacterium]|nr:aminopeptidase P family protein [Dongiaceae bacterium]
MSLAEQPYLGDEALAGMLKKAGLRVDLSQIRGLLAGVLAAPAGEHPDAWIDLVAPAADKTCRAQLDALKRQLAEEAPPARLKSTSERLAALRKELERRGLAGFLVPRADEHQGEYVPPRAERLAWLTGFTGSAGLAIVLAGKAAVFVDGRYTLQVRDQVDTALFEPQHLIEQPPESWIAANLPKGGRLGYDPWLHTPDGVKRLRQAAEKAGGTLVAVDGNPLDAVWSDQPPPPLAPVVPQDLRFAGRSAQDKRESLGRVLAGDGIAAAVLTNPDSLAWLLNIRGADVPRTPFALGFAILHDDGGVELFMDRRKFTPGLENHLGNQVAVSAPEGFAASLDRLGQAKARVLADPATAPSWIFDRLSAAGAVIAERDDPCLLPKACKNEAELQGTRSAHRRDGAAVTGFLHWLAEAAPKGAVDELAAAAKLAEFRRAGDLFRDFSFDTISGAGPNGAIVHYRSSERTNRPLELGEPYLVDSGAQYVDGTTDITRTVAIGPQSAEAKDRFTRVLKGHIALALARFPKGTTGSQLDSLARYALWQVGLDYDHGTGHGVGSFLSVHEGPQRISKIPNRVALEPGMIVSNEPGYYKTGAYGIRIENLVTVIEDPRPGDERPMLAFETLTLAPIDRNLVDKGLLTAAEIAWLDAYHARVREVLSPQLDAATAAWLGQATAPI